MSFGSALSVPLWALCLCLFLILQIIIHFFKYQWIPDWNWRMDWPDQLENGFHCSQLHFFLRCCLHNQVRIYFQCPWKLLKLIWRNRDKSGALSPMLMTLLVLKIFLESLGKVIIFSTFLYINNNGQFDAIQTIVGFYSMVLVMIIFNGIFSRHHLGSPENVIGNIYLKF